MPRIPGRAGAGREETSRAFPCPQARITKGRINSLGGSTPALDCHPFGGRDTVLPSVHTVPGMGSPDLADSLCPHHIHSDLMCKPHGPTEPVWKRGLFYPEDQTASHAAPINTGSAVSQSLWESCFKTAPLLCLVSYNESSYYLLCILQLWKIFLVLRAKLEESNMYRLKRLCLGPS